MIWSVSDPHVTLKSISINFLRKSSVMVWKLFGPQLDEIYELEAENYIMSIVAMRSFPEAGLEGSNP